jgi:germacradienol/geosmin synthase
MDIPPPYQPRRSPDLGAARAHTADWARRMGLMRLQIWDDQDLSDFDFALFAALVHPDARGERLNLVADWYVFGWFLDDLLLEQYKRSRDVVGARRFLASLADTSAPARNPVEVALADLLLRTPDNGRLLACVPNLVGDGLWEIENIAQGRIPEPIDYVEMRRASGGSLWAAQLVELVLGADLSRVTSTTARRLHAAFADAVDLHNDLVSYQRETEYEQEVSNGVVVTEAFLGTGPIMAAVRTHELMTARLEVFERLVPVLLAEYPELDRYVRGLRDWVAGDFQWHLETNRYRESSWRRKKFGMLRGPRGPGTSSAAVLHPKTLLRLGEPG